MTTETAKPQAVSGKEYQLLINGQPSPARSGETLERRYPANRDVVVATFPNARVEDPAPALQPARDAFDSGVCSNPPARNRAAVLRKPADKIRQESAELSRL